MALENLEPNVHVLLSSFAVRGRCTVRILDSEPSALDKQCVQSKEVLLIVSVGGAYHLGFCNAQGLYEQQLIRSEEILSILIRYKAGDVIHHTEHADQMNALLHPSLRLNVPLMNMVFYVEGGPSPVVRVFAKNTASGIDPVYLSYAVPLRLFSNDESFEFPASHADFSAHHNTIIPTGSLFEFVTQGGARCIQAIDICRDHVMQHSLVLFLRRIVSETFSNDLIYDQIEHCITSNSISACKESTISTRALRVDPRRDSTYTHPSSAGQLLLPAASLNEMLSKSYPYMNVLERANGYDIKNPPFGSNFSIDVLEERSAMRCRGIYETGIGRHNHRIRERLRFFATSQGWMPDHAPGHVEPGFWGHFFNADKHEEALCTSADEATLIRMLDLRDHGGSTLLHWAARNMSKRALSTLLLKLPVTHLLNAVMKQNSQNDTILFDLFERTPTVLVRVLNALTASKRLLLLQEKNRREETLLELWLRKISMREAILVYDEALMLLPTLIHTAADLRDFLRRLPSEQVTRLFSILEPMIVSHIDSRVSLVMVLQYLSPEHRGRVCRLVLVGSARWLIAEADVRAVCNLLMPEDRRMFIDGLSRENIKSKVQGPMTMRHIGREDRLGDAAALSKRLNSQSKLIDEEMCDGRTPS